MKILICTGIYPPQVGGPAYYALSLERELARQGHRPNILTYKLERVLPTFVRHGLFFIRALIAGVGADCIIALDTFSVAWPSVMAARLLRKKIIIRVGGDFLWETYIERTKEEIPLKHFYTEQLITLTLKERLIFLITRYTLKHASAVVFSTEWQKKIWTKAYNLTQKGRKKNKRPLLAVIENEYVPHSKESISEHNPSQNKVYLWAGRMISLKNVTRLKRAGALAQEYDSSIHLSIVTNVPKKELLERMRACYAFVLPSLSDVSPNIVLDALACGKPCIVTEETGIADRLGDTVLYVDPLDEVDIERKILQLANPEQYALYAQRAADFSVTHTIEDIVEEFLDVCVRSA